MGREFADRLPRLAAVCGDKRPLDEAVILGAFSRGVVGWALAGRRPASSTTLTEAPFVPPRRRAVEMSRVANRRFNLSTRLT
jgi:hypothetical protein